MRKTQKLTGKIIKNPETWNEGTPAYRRSTVIKNIQLLYGQHKEFWKSSLLQAFWILMRNVPGACTLIKHIHRQGRGLTHTHYTNAACQQYNNYPLLSIYAYSIDAFVFIQYKLLVRCLCFHWITYDEVQLHKKKFWHSCYSCLIQCVTEIYIYSPRLTKPTAYYMLYILYICTYYILNLGPHAICLVCWRDSRTVCLDLLVIPHRRSTDFTAANHSRADIQRNSRNI